jgi:hypothetical protein
MTEMLGLDGVSLAREPQAAQGASTRRPEVVKRLGQIPLKSVVKIERIDGTKLNAFLEEVTPDAITVTILAKTNRTKEIIPIEDIKKIEEARGHTLRNILLGVGIGFGVLVGSCAAASRSTGVSDATLVTPHGGGHGSG